MYRKVWYTMVEEIDGEGPSPVLQTWGMKVIAI